MKKYILIIFSLSLFFLNPLQGRDIDLDRIYIHTDSPHYARLSSFKIEAYAAAASRFIIRDVIFADWLNGLEILYIRELPETNVIGSFHLVRQTHREIIRIPGTVASSILSIDGRYLYLKVLRISSDGIPDNYRLTINMKDGAVRSERTPFPFMDFTLAPGTSGFLAESGTGIMEISPDTMSSVLILKKQAYSSLFDDKNPVMLHMSPNRKYRLLISGSGGQYTGWLYRDNSKIRFNDITSSSELLWLNNRELLYRSGFTGEYSITRYNTETGSRQNIISGSLNTNLNASRDLQNICFLQNQMITLFTPSSGTLLLTGLEGEDVRFSPDGSRFISLLYRKLFLSRRDAPKTKNRELVDIAEKILSQYRILEKDRNLWENEYAGQYIGKKIGIYSRFVKAR